MRRPDGRERITARLRRFSVRGLTVYLSSVAADRDDSGKRQACAETKLGRQRNLHRKGDLGREIDSGKIFILIVFLTFYKIKSTKCASNVRFLVAL